MARSTVFASLLTISLLGTFALAREPVPMDRPAGPSMGLPGGPSVRGLDGGGQGVTAGQPLSASQRRAARDKGVSWLLANQHSDGGWSSGAHGSNGLDAGSDVATTSFVGLALLRDEASGKSHDDALKRAVERVVASVEQAPEGAALATPAGTQIQYKMGTLVDLHFASLFLGEVVTRYPGSFGARVESAYGKVLSKQQAAQRADGSFDGEGWAPVLSTSIAAQGLNTAAERGRKIDRDVLAKSDDYQAKLGGAGGFDASAGAGVPLYAVASALSSNADTAKRAGGEAKSRAEGVQRQAAASVAGDASGGLMAGFGSIGGEEMVSYMMISDTLVAEGGQPWKDWDAKVAGYLGSIQNADGTWAGQHCITSTAFTTAGALMTLGAQDWAGRRQVGKAIETPIALAPADPLKMHTESR